MQKPDTGKVIMKQQSITTQNIIDKSKNEDCYMIVLIYFTIKSEIIIKIEKKII